MHARQVLDAPLKSLRRAVIACASTMSGTRADDLKAAATDYGIAFERSLDAIARDSRDDDVRMITGDVAMTLCTLPHDAVMRSAVRAMQAMSGGGRTRQSTPALAISSGEPVSALYFKLLGGGR
jgi:hypothetical protein